MNTLDTIITTHRPALLAYTTRLLNGDTHHAEDVLQETWLRAWRNLDKLTDTRGSVRGWLMRVAHNIAIDHHRARTARPTEVTMPDNDPTSTPAHTDDILDRMVVETALDTLPHTHRQTLIEIYWADRTTTATATVLQIPVGTVKSRVHNALRTLRDTAPALTAA
ncbi:sigma-70 family RNA polymerase sigma factor [Actinokineospora bangkokensis]|uniref:RNA polymerase n=1 Tax=Actinokineospora bangkokensis TaxID=1193682 RepID=A0A1Q9LNQ0_9PSEU|nr:sigma-70 family RNA polymerase sigma factor [Actinokineospora bangkokensis]OLR93614.1 hypothetical protein BJP25_15155 [Actinokineospora bangkokensis]